MQLSVKKEERRFGTREFINILDACKFIPDYLPLPETSVCSFIGKSVGFGRVNANHKSLEPNARFLEFYCSDMGKNGRSPYSKAIVGWSFVNNRELLALQAAERKMTLSYEEVLLALDSRRNLLKLPFLD